MKTLSVDFLVLGSGFGGSLLARILAKAGRCVALIDRSNHPRFAIGESSTPLADDTLKLIAEEYGLHDLIPLTTYGQWKAAHPELTCGLKRGFSYFDHTRGLPMATNSQLLVAASSADETADTHWLRSDVDEYFFKTANEQGAHTFQNVVYSLQQHGSSWLLEGHSNESPISIKSPFIVDATGHAGQALKHLGVGSQTTSLKTTSYATYAHFADVEPVESMLDAFGVDTSNHPFPCDHAAVHHVLDDGWMWQLRFDDNTVSAGFVSRNPVLKQSTKDAGAIEHWNERLKQHPFLEKQFRSARIVRPDHGIQDTGRLQRLASIAAGPNWTALPHTAGFIDPLHSTGIAHTLFGIRNLASILLENTDEVQLTNKLLQYSEQTIDELQFIDELIEGCYASLPHFRLWSAWCMLYFAAVTSMEQIDAHNASFLQAADVDFRSVVRNARQQLQNAINANGTETSCQKFEDWLRHEITPWNHVGLLDEHCNGMYHTTAAPHR